MPSCVAWQLQAARVFWTQTTDLCQHKNPNVYPELAQFPETKQAANVKFAA